MRGALNRVHLKTPMILQPASQPADTAAGRLTRLSGKQRDSTTTTTTTTTNTTTNNNNKQIHNDKY